MSSASTPSADPSEPVTPGKRPTIPEGDEEDDGMKYDVKVAGVMSQVRALCGDDLGGIVRFDPSNFNLRAVHARNYLDAIALRLFSSRDVPLIQDQMKDRFREIFRSNRRQGAEPIERMDRSFIVAKSLLDTVYEFIKTIDLKEMAANIAFNSTNTDVSAHYAFTDVAGRNHLSDEGRALLSRLMRGNPNPAKVILAFSAAIDHEHYDSEIAGAGPLAQPDAQDVQRLLREDLQMPEANLQGAYPLLQRLAEAVEAYRTAPRADLNLVNPGPVPTTGPAASIADHRRSYERYHNARGLVVAIETAATSLRNYLVGPPPQPVTALTGFPAFVGKMQTNPPINDLLPNPMEVKNMIASAMGRELQAVDQYKRLAETPQQGLQGADACDAILSNYITRVGGVDEDTANEALASLTSRVKTADPKLRRDRTRYALIEVDHDFNDRLAEFNELNKDAAGGGMTPYDRFADRLNHGTELLHGDPNAQENPLENVKARYYTLWYVTKLLPPGDEKLMPISERMAREMTRLRTAIVKRQTDAYLLWLQEAGNGRITQEQAAELGMKNTNPESLSYDKIQKKALKDLNPISESEIEPRMLFKVKQNVDHAWHPLHEDKEYYKSVSWYHPANLKKGAKAVGGFYKDHKISGGAGAAVGAGLGFFLGGPFGVVPGTILGGVAGGAVYEGTKATVKGVAAAATWGFGGVVGHLFSTSKFLNPGGGSGSSGGDHKKDHK